VKAWLAAAAIGLAGLAPAWAQDQGLVAAVRSENREAALAMIDEGADVTQGEPDGSTPLLWGAHLGDAELVEKLLAAGADPNRANDYGATPLSEAAIMGEADVIALLLDAGVDANARGADGQTALMAVARTGRIDAARILLDHGADVNAVEEWGGQTALMWAASQQQPEMIRLLIDRGAEVDARSVVRDWGRRITAESRVKDLNYGGFTPLLYAAREGCAECARALVEGGADINLISPDSITPLVMAITNIHWDTAAYLIEAGADVNRWDLWGRNPLYQAVDVNTTPRGGRPDLPSTDATTGLQVIEMLLERGANVNMQLKLFAPYRAVGPDRGGDPALTVGATPLLRAVKGGDVAATELLLRYDPLVDLPNMNGLTPLMAAAGGGYGAADTRGRFMTEQQGLAEARLLLDAGADINAKDNTGRTALHGATQRGWMEMIRFLVENGADVNAADNNGMTPHDIAAGVRRGPGGFGPAPDPKPEVAAVLVELGAVPGEPPAPPAAAPG
jgi:ankyrin repeat protein